MGVGATWSTWGARWFERAGVRTFGAASHSTDHWNSISLFSRGRDAHLPSSSPPRRARPTREWGRQTALRPEKALGYLIAKKKGTKKAGLGFANPKLVSGNIRKLRHGQTVRKSPKKLHPISTGGSGDSKTFTICSYHGESFGITFHHHPSRPGVGRGANHPAAFGASGPEPRKSVQRSDESSNRYAM